MKEFFIAKKFGAEALDMLKKITGILEKYSAQGYDLSLRQLYYQLVAGNLIPGDRTYTNVNGKWVKDPNGSINAEPNYKWIGDVVSDARLAGLIDWGMISDRGRVTVTNPHWDSPQEIVESAAQGFRIDKWADQQVHVEVMVEKQALEGVLIPVCRELDISFTANKGYSSSSALYEAGKRFQDLMRDGKQVHLIYLGDHDPSGIDMTRDVMHRVNLFATVIDGEMFEAGGGGHDWGSPEGIQVHRIALNLPQVKQLNPPENPAKLTDSRADGYIARFGRSSWELDAIEPKALADLVRKAVIPLRDHAAWAQSVEKEKGMRAELLAFAKSKRSGK